MKGSAHTCFVHILMHQNTHNRVIFDFCLCGIYLALSCGFGPGSSTTISSTLGSSNSVLSTNKCLDFKSRETYNTAFLFLVH